MANALAEAFGPSRLHFGSNIPVHPNDKAIALRNRELRQLGLEEAFGRAVRQRHE